MSDIHLKTHEGDTKPWYALNGSRKQREFAFTATITRIGAPSG